MRRLWRATLTAMFGAATAAWAQASAAQAPAPRPAHVVTNPRWLKLPDAADMARYYPATAGRQDGAAKIRCVVTAAGTLENCAVVSETPEGLGFGAAAVAMSASFQMQPRTVDGVPVGGTVINIPIRFAFPVDPDAGHVISNPHVLKVPTDEEMNKFLPEKSRGEGGAAQLQCEVTSVGQLEACTVLKESPMREGFGAAALAAAPLFLMHPKTRDGVPVDRAPVLVPVWFTAYLTLAEDVGRVVVNPKLLKSPTEDEIERYLPAKTGREGGSARIQCVVTIVGTLENCTLLEETPPGSGFGATALKVAPLYLLAPKTVDGVAVGGTSITIPMLFSDAALRAEDAGHVITNPHWLKLPTADDMSNFWPANGLHDGAAKLRCVVTSRGTLDKCSVLSESPEGAGFGGAAMLLTPLFVMEPKTVDGTPVGGVIIIPIRFTGGAAVSSPSAHIKVANSLAWSAAPTAAELAGAFPKDAVGRTARAHVVLRCAVGHDGGVHDCDTMTEQPGGMGFGRAARELGKRFRIFDDPGYAKQVKDFYVDIPFDFHDPAQPAPPPALLDPVWLETADPAMAGKLFPEAAAKAGLKTGRAVLTCQAVHDGSLTGCAVVDELPPGLGFGQAALAIAAVMKMNLWTPQGFPVDGANIRLPVRVNLTETAPPAAPTPGR